MNFFRSITILNLLLLAIPAFPATVFHEGLKFDAATISDVDSFFRSQPNPNGAVGPTQYILITNNHIRSFNKATGLPDGILDIDSSCLFGRSCFDTRLIYDIWGQRWIALAGVNNLSDGTAPTCMIAYSDGPIITKSTQWTVKVFDSAEILPPDGGGQDSALIAADHNAVYITMNTFTAEGDFGGVALIVIPQSSFVPGALGSYTVLPGIYPGTGSLGEFAPPAYNFDSDSEFGYMINAQTYWEGPAANYNNLYLFRIVKPGSTGPTLTPQVAVPVPQYSDTEDFGFVPHQGNLYGENGNLQATWNVFDSVVHVRNKQLYAAHNIPVTATGIGALTGDRLGIRWYQFDLTGDPSGNGTGSETGATVPALVQYGTIYDTAEENPVSYWMPAIMTNQDSDMVISGNFAGDTEYIRTFYASRKHDDATGTTREIVNLDENDQAYNFGTLVYNNPNGQRWGDYATIYPDPDNDLVLWSTNEHVVKQNGWGILATQLIPN